MLFTGRFRCRIVACWPALGYIFGQRPPQHRSHAEFFAAHLQGFRPKSSPRVALRFILGTIPRRLTTPTCPPHLFNYAYSHSPLSTASKRNEVMAGLSCALPVRWREMRGRAKRRFEGRRFSHLPANPIRSSRSAKQVKSLASRPSACFFPPHEIHSV